VLLENVVDGGCSHSARLWNEMSSALVLLLAKDVSGEDKSEPPVEDVDCCRFCNNCQ